MKTTMMNQVTKGVATDRIPKVVAAGVLTASLIAGADNVAALALTAATYGAAEVTRARLGVRSFKSVPASANSHVKPIAGHTP